MRYRTVTVKSKALGQVLTPRALADRLAKSLSGKGQTWLELGVGTGRIAQACVEHRQPERYTGLELDPNMLNNCIRHPSIHLIQSNVLHAPDLQQTLANQKFDCVVGNPPYGSTKISSHGIDRLNDLCPGINQTTDWGQLDLYFVLESLSRLKRPGQAAFIVSAAMIEDPKLQVFRQHLLSQANEVQCYELPLDSFDHKAEVRSFLLIARYAATKKRKCKVIAGRIGDDGFDIIEKQPISLEQAILCLSLSHHEFLDFDASLRRKRGCVSLKDLKVEITRGSKSKSEFINLGITHFHLSDFPTNATEIHLPHHCDERFKLAQAGDILIPRVGSRCLTKQALVTDGSLPFTDSIYRLQLPKKNRNRVIDWMSSAEGAFWRRSAAKGSCAKHLTIQSLLNMPVPLQSTHT